MKKTTLVVLIFVGLWIATKLASTKILGSQESWNVGVFTNILFVLLVCFFALRIKYAGIKTYAPFNFLQDVKSALRPAALYVVAVCGFIWLNFGVLDRQFLEGKIDEAMAIAQEQLKDPEAMARAYEQDPTIKDLTEEELLQSKRDQTEFIFKPFFITTLSFVALITMMIIYGVLIVVFFRKVLHRHLYPRAT